LRTSRLFVAGSTGAVGKVVCRLAASADPKVDAFAHTRREGGFALSDEPALVAALQGRTTVLQLIGTMRNRFAKGDTYETSDIGTTRQLVEAAKKAGSIDHIVLLSSVGAGGMGAYLKAKGEAERLVRESGIPWTTFRPSMFVGEDRKPPPLWGAITRGLGLKKWQPIPVEALAGAILRVAIARGPLGEVLEGSSLWAVVGPA
jgi:uncharacterized protein YbjT (DUF2867 family)